MGINVAKTMANAKEAMSQDAFQKASGVLNDARNIIREEIQRKTSPEIKNVINKLQSGGRISGSEVALIKAWIVGDAVGYVTMENNFQDWICEYEKLRNALEGYENKDWSSEDLVKLYGLLEDAARVGCDIANFLEKKDRIEKFESAIRDDSDKDQKDFLVKILSGKLRSQDY